MRFITDIHGIGLSGDDNHEGPLLESLRKLSIGVSQVPDVLGCNWAPLTGEFNSSLADYAADVLAFFDTETEAKIMAELDRCIGRDHVIFAHSMGTIWLMRWICLNLKRGTIERIPKLIITAGSPLCNKLFASIQADLYKSIHLLPTLEWTNFADKRDIVSFSPMNAVELPEMLPCYRRLGCKTTIVNNGSSPHTGFRSNLTVAARVFAYALS